MRSMRKPERRSLLSVLMARLRKSPQAPPAQYAPTRRFQAISIYRGVTACDMARTFSEHRFLAKDAPPLPLGGCTMSAQCQCRYIKHRDRRGEARRLVDFGVAVRLFDGRERRSKRGRRADD
jgi:hypothetical protein